MAETLPFEATMSSAQSPDYCARARAAIEAMREPTEAMVVSAVDGAARMPPLSEDMDFTEVWKAMIDEALK